jgi:DNA-binding SARP family transcriptional activator
VVSGGVSPVSEVAHLVRDRRQRAGLTQPELARRSGVSVRALRDIEHGRVGRPRAVSLDRLTRALGMSEAERDQLRGAVDAAPTRFDDGVRVDILGPLAARVGARAVRIGPRVQHTLLGLLALRANDVVTHDEIVDTLWGDDPPRTWLTQVYTAVGRLRTLFEPHRPARKTGNLLRSTASGYRLDLEYIDVHRFDELTAEAARVRVHGDDGAAVRLYDLALRCWRGPVLADAHERLRTHPAALALSRRRVQATMACADAAEAAGHHDLAIEWLRIVADAELLHEPVHARLVKALSRHGDRVPPAQLPTDVAGFVGRADLLARLDALISADGVGAVACLCGVAGIGKTALAVHWAHRVANRFADGQLYVNLRGSTSDARIPGPAEALGAILDALDVPGHRLPADLGGRAALYRDLLARRRLLVVLDDARDAGQVRPLLSGTSGCVIVVTSREPLMEPAGGATIVLNPLSRAGARDLLTCRLGSDRVAAGSAAVDEIVSVCAGLPRALVTVAARAATYPDFPLSILADELTGRTPAWARERYESGLPVESLAATPVVSGWSSSVRMS